VSVVDETDPHSSLSVEIEYDVRHDRCPPARPEHYGSINKLRYTWTILDEDEIPIPDPGTVPEEQVASGRLVLWVPDPDGTGVDVVTPARTVDDREFPVLDLSILETEFVGSVGYGTGDRQWTWPDEPAQESASEPPHPRERQFNRPHC
jgi:hypothetical protein